MKLREWLDGLAPRERNLVYLAAGLAAIALLYFSVVMPLQTSNARRAARVEQIKKFFLLDTQLTAEDEELTPTMKLKRKLVQTKYAEQIEAMYRG